MNGYTDLQKKIRCFHFFFENKNAKVRRNVLFERMPHFKNLRKSYEIGKKKYFALRIFFKKKRCLLLE
jgi:hypothetical protein